jgi:hypothetical protein
VRNTIIAAAAALALTSTATLAAGYDAPVNLPTFYAEFNEAADKAKVTKEDTPTTQIIAVKATPKQDADN